MVRKKISATSRSANASSTVVDVLREFLASRVDGKRRVCVALSGGLDSVVLLHASCALMTTARLPIELSAIHVHHGLSPNAEAWSAFCSVLCESLQVPLDVVRVEVPKDSGEGLEAAARRQRYSAFAACGADWLALAHHRDDQAETVLLNLLRGAGVAGAAGMLAERPRRNGPTLIRPLLDLPRSALADYANAHGLRWIDDESNADVHFRRNFLRHDVLPLLEEKFPAAQRALSRAAGHFAEGAALLRELAAIDRVAVMGVSGRLGLAAFNALSPARARNLLRQTWVEAGFRAPDARWLDEALAQLASASPLSEMRVETPDGALCVYRGEIYFLRQMPPVDALPMRWHGENVLPWAGGWLRLTGAPGVGIGLRHLTGAIVEIRARQGGERLQCHPARPRRNLRNVLQERGMPPWERARLPFLWIGDRLAWVGGVGVDVAFACAPDEAGVLPVWDAGQVEVLASGGDASAV